MPPFVRRSARLGDPAALTIKVIASNHTVAEHGINMLAVGDGRGRGLGIGRGNVQQRARIILLPPNLPARQRVQAEDGELFLERSVSESLVFDDGRLRNSGYTADQGFGLRAVRGEVTGYAHSTEISETSLRRAAQTARLAVGRGGAVLADPAPMRAQHLYAAADPAEGIPISRRIALLREIDDYARWRLREGLDDIGLTLRHEADITAFEGTRPARMPRTLA